MELLNWREYLKNHELNSSIYKGLIEIENEKKKILEESIIPGNLEDCGLFFQGVEGCVESLKDMSQMLQEGVNPQISDLFGGAILANTDTAKEYLEIISNYTESGIQV
ncbi:MAG TPA: hypothetical protein DEP72_05170 [Clostridiales bacterium]|nr:MAG: hypothetical protein A2Y18_02320 [Clostridiales bacterium GWD2_32_19]HCC07532.1 hypothetical protein [Clostridiales bacterium]